MYFMGMGDMEEDIGGPIHAPILPLHLEVRKIQPFCLLSLPVLNVKTIAVHSINPIFIMVNLQYRPTRNINPFQILKIEKKQLFCLEKYWYLCV